MSTLSCYVMQEPSPLEVVKSNFFMRGPSSHPLGEAREMSDPTPGICYSPQGHSFRTLFQL